jgi:4-hydroxy-2-oxovalerate aldolase
VSREVRLLDCTLRDGSYVVEFQFTAEDTAAIAAALESAGIRAIEIGHGLGMHASQAGKGQAAATDEEYMRAASRTLTTARWGMFYIPGIGRLEDLDRAADHGMHFVRIGANAPEIDQAEPAVKHARARGFDVSVNLMKSYVVPPEEFARLGARAAGFGAQVVCLVDSAGTMLPEHVRDYVQALGVRTSAEIGFHGHDNLALGMANVLAALDAGATVVDATLQGIGRSGGNPATEILVALLQRRGQAADVDLNRLMDVSQRIIRPMLRGRGLDPLDITAGYAGFHSGYLQMVLQQASRFRVDPRELIVAVSQVDQLHATDAMVAEAASALQQRQAGRSGLHVVTVPDLADAVGSRPATRLAGEAAREVAAKVHAVAMKTGKQGVFNIVARQVPEGRAAVSPFVQEEFEFIIGSAVADAPDQVRELVDAADGLVDLFFVDAGRRPCLPAPLAATARDAARRSRVLAYDDGDVWVRSVQREMDAVGLGEAPGALVVMGCDSMAMKLALSLVERYGRVRLSGASRAALDEARRALDCLGHSSAAIEVEPDPVVAARTAAVVVAFAAASIGADVVDALPADAVVFDAGVGTLRDEALEASARRGLRVIRPDMRASLAAELAATLGTARLVGELMGRSTLGGVPVVAGGIVGRRGDVIVDSISSPTRVIGIADGRGTVIYDRPPEFADAVARVEREIWQRRIGANG